jgi:hypothetical protein
MPKEAWEHGGSEVQVAIGNIPAEVMRVLKGMQA